MIDVTVDDGTTTIIITYTGESQKVQDVLTDSAHKLHSEGFGPVNEGGEKVVWDDLTNSDKLALVDAFVKRSLLSYACTWHIKAGESARLIAARIEAWDKYDLGV